MSLTLSIQRTVQSQARQFTLDIDIQTDVRHIALYGPSGSGKSLTVQSVAGLLKPDHGRISINGRVYFDSQQGVDLKPRQRRVAYLFQDYGLFPHLTAAQNICFGLNTGWFNRRVQDLPAPAQRWARAFELEPVLDSYPSELSGGQKQRCALARALAVEPEILLLDEPLAALDQDLRIRLRAELAQLQRQLDIPTILITHDPEDARVLAQEVYRIRDGRIVDCCPADELDPSHQLDLIPLQS
ncbi:sulfate/molybdate ABC transporter ATP-binding protein [Alcaligenes sp. SDU_A2]|uniref:sulfate/molybdate ABC transporter ATP-binding protein n=1 Tax=Alcaligenes sp. SDU_A2 TaxID=3136634 RepID=UPI00311D98AD